MADGQHEVTQLLQAAGAGDSRAARSLLPLVYEELRKLARARMANEPADHTLQATALVHEAWLRLVGDAPVEWRDRGHFFAAASEAMRRVLVDHARRAGAEKRGGAAARVTLGTADEPIELPAQRALEVEDALAALERSDARAAAVARLRLLCGLTVDETAQALAISARTVHREWEWAKARLMQIVR